MTLPVNELLVSSMCVCFTPLNVLIAKRIAENNQFRFERGLYITSVYSEKHKNYVDKMNEFCEFTEYLVLPDFNVHFKPRHLSILMKRLKYRVFFRKFSTIELLYCPGTYNDYYYALLSAVSFKRLYTYDDGLINIYDDGKLVRNPNFLGKLFYLMAGITYWPTRIREKSFLHYTIYQAQHTFSRICNVELLPKDTHSNNNKKTIKKLFLGALPEASEDMWNVIKDSITLIKPDGYIAHPREVERKIEQIEYVKTSLIAEDYILTNLRNDPELNYEVYGYDTTALFNLARTNGVKAISVLPNKPENMVLRDLMKDSGIHLLS